MCERIGDFLMVKTGTKFYPLDPKIEEIHIEDIAHSTSMMCRYNGHTEIFYSVASHAIMVCKELQYRGCSPLVQMWGLLHDGSEAYICDIPRPLKGDLKEYSGIEKKIQDLIYLKFSGVIPSEFTYMPVKCIDDEALLFEAKNYVQDHSWIWKDPEIHVEPVIGPSEVVKPKFLEQYYRLKKELKL